MAAMLLFSMEGYARRGGGGFSRSSSRSSRSSSWGSSKKSSSPSKSSGWGSSSKSKATSSHKPLPLPAKYQKKAASETAVKSPTDKKIATPKAKSSSATSAKLAKSTKTTGKTTQTKAVSKYKSKQDSLKAMKNDPKLATQYRTDYKTKPATRPQYVPSHYTPAGGTRVVVVHRGGYGYGYYSGGVWMAYDPFMDPYNYNYFSTRHSSYAMAAAREDEAEARSMEAEARKLEAEQRIAEAGGDPAAVREKVEKKGSGWGIFLGIVLILAIGGAAFYVITKD